MKKMEAKVVNLEEIKSDLKIEYPCNWQYKIILDKDDDIDELVKKLDIKNAKISSSKSTSNYKSYNLSVKVASEADRLELFSLLKKNAKFVL